MGDRPEKKLNLLVKEIRNAYDEASEEFGNLSEDLVKNPSVRLLFDLIKNLKETAYDLDSVLEAEGKDSRLELGERLEGLFLFPIGTKVRTLYGHHYFSNYHEFAEFYGFPDSVGDKNHTPKVGSIGTVIFRAPHLRYDDDSEDSRFLREKYGSHITQKLLYVAEVDGKQYIVEQEGLELAE